MRARVAGAYCNSSLGPNLEHHACIVCEVPWKISVGTYTSGLVLERHDTEEVHTRSASQCPTHHDNYELRQIYSDKLTAIMDIRVVKFWRTMTVSIERVKTTACRRIFPMLSTHTSFKQFHVAGQEYISPRLKSPVQHIDKHVQYSCYRV